jgi:hypothetical protein
MHMQHTCFGPFDKRPAALLLWKSVLAQKEILVHARPEKSLFNRGMCLQCDRKGMHEAHEREEKVS